MKLKLFCVLALLLMVLPGRAVLKERDLARTLGVLRAELAADYDKQQMFMQMYEQQGVAQHQQLVSYMNQCEQIGLMLYSQSTENTFDMAYACQQAVDLYRQLSTKSGNTLPYEKIITRMKTEIERYDALIASLKSMPPVAESDGEVLTQSDSILLSAIDSLAAAIRPEDADEKAALPTPMLDDDAQENHEPLYLSGQQLVDRRECLEYAQTLRDNMQMFLESLEAESSYYESVRDKVSNLNRFAQMRYKMLQDNIFKSGGANYFTILANLPRYIASAQRAAVTKYKPFKQHEQTFSEWRGMSVLFISIFVLFYLSVALAITYVALRWLMPRRWRGEDYETKRRILTWVVGVALFAVIVMAIRSFVKFNFIYMGTGLIINIAWLLEAIFLSLYIRLKGKEMIHAALIYTPLMIISAIVIMFRIVLIPNGILNLIFPPILLAFAFWQIRMVKRHQDGLPMLDVIYSYVTAVTMVIATIAAWSGYTLMAVQIMVWWTFQLAAITTITCLYDIMEMYENNSLIRRVTSSKAWVTSDEGHEEPNMKRLLRHIRQGRYITSTWLYDLFNRTLVPILAVLSVLVSIYWAAEIFAMTSMCQKAFFYNFINQEDLIQVSLFKLCQVAALWFIFSYLNYAVRSFYVHYRRIMAESDETPNLTLARNVIAIFMWGIYFIIALVILHVPKSGISIVTAGLATGLGFAMQDLIENFFYGLSLMTGRLRVGDFIECDGIRGKVESITYQSTQIITSDGCVIAFLNKALFSKNFKNMTRNHSYELISVPVGVAYGTDVKKVREMIIKAVEPICREETESGLPLSDTSRPVQVRFDDFGDSSVDLKVLVWMLVEERAPLTARIKEAIYNTLNENGIEIPFPQRDVHIISR